MSKNSILAISLLLLSLTGFAQSKESPDALPNVAEAMKSKDDTNKVIILNNLGKAFFNRGASDSAIFIGKYTLKLSQKLNYAMGEANANSLLGVAIFDFGKYQEAINYYFKALRIFNKLKYTKAVASMYNNIGNVYRRIHDFPNAIKYHWEALKLHRAIGDERGIGKTYVGLAMIAKDQKQLKTALAQYDTALGIMNKIQDKRGLSIIYNNMGNIFLDLKDYQSALQYQLAGLDLNEASGDPEALGYSYENIGSIYNAMKMPKEGRKWSQKSLALAKEKNLLPLISENYRILATTDSLEGNFESALKNYMLYDQLNDSLVNKENIKKITEAGLKYEFEKQEIVNDLHHENEIAELRNKWKTSLLIFLLLAVSGFSLFFISRGRRKKEQLLLRSQNKIAVLEKEKLDSKLQQAGEHIKTFVKRINEKDMLIETISSKLEILKTEYGKDPVRAKNTLSDLRGMCILTNEDWLIFLGNFNILYPKFSIRVKRFCPKITPSELRFLMLAKIGLEYKQMANTLGVSKDTIRVTWNRVRNKLEGTTEDTPYTLINKIENQADLV